jgi:transposase
VIEDDERKLPMRRVLRNGRRRYDAASKERLVAACLEPGMSVSRLALEHGINTNLLRKWIKTAREAQSLPPSSPSAFIPVVAADRSPPMRGSMSDMPATRGDERLAASRGLGRLSSPPKVNASLPNGVNLTLECGDVDALTAIIGALGDVQARR